MDDWTIFEHTVGKNQFIKHLTEQARQLILVVSVSLSSFVNKDSATFLTKLCYRLTENMNTKCLSQWLAYSPRIMNGGCILMMMMGAYAWYTTNYFVFFFWYIVLKSLIVKNEYLMVIQQKETLITDWLSHKVSLYLLTLH